MVRYMSGPFQKTLVRATSSSKMSAPNSMLLRWVSASPEMKLGREALGHIERVEPSSRALVVNGVLISVFHVEGCSLASEVFSSSG